MRFKIASVDSMIVYFGDVISEDVSKKVTNAYFELKNNPLDGVLELIPSFSSLLIKYDIFLYSFDRLENILRKRFENLKDVKLKSTLKEVKAYYGLEVGLDLQILSKELRLDVEEIIDLHVKPIYQVYAVGFLPAFAYMGQTDKKITSKRLKNPRKVVPKGSIGIADNQTAIYPQESPGGWNIIGRCPSELFSPNYEGLSYLKMGDRVKFKPISKDEFLSLGGQL